MVIIEDTLYSGFILTLLVSCNVLALLICGTAASSTIDLKVSTTLLLGSGPAVATRVETSSLVHLNPQMHHQDSAKSPLHGIQTDPLSPLPSEGYLWKAANFRIETWWYCHHSSSLRWARAWKFGPQQKLNYSIYKISSTHPADVS